MFARRFAFLLLSSVALVTACSTGGADSTAPAGSLTQAASGAATTVKVNLTDALKIEPGSMTVPAGVPVTFVITNIGATDHEFYLGDEAAQAEHEKQMASMGGMSHDETAGISVKAGQTKELTYTFANAGVTLAGCHVTGHFGGGMKAAITVTG